MTVSMPLSTKVTSFDLNSVRLSQSRKVLRAFEIKRTFKTGSSSNGTSDACTVPVVRLLRVNDITAEEFALASSFLSFV